MSMAEQVRDEFRRWVPVIFPWVRVFISASGKRCHGRPMIFGELCGPAQGPHTSEHGMRPQKRKAAAIVAIILGALTGDAARAADVPLPQAEYNVNPPAYYEPEVLVPYERPVLYGYPPPPPPVYYRVGPPPVVVVPGPFYPRRYYGAWYRHPPYGAYGGPVARGPLSNGRRF